MRLVKKAFERIAAQGGIPIVGRWAALYMTSVLEYMISEVLELAGDAALKTKKARQTRPKIDTVHMIAAMKGCVRTRAFRARSVSRRPVCLGIFPYSCATLHLATAATLSSPWRAQRRGAQGVDKGRHRHRRVLGERLRGQEVDKMPCAASAARAVQGRQAAMVGGAGRRRGE